MRMLRTIGSLMLVLLLVTAAGRSTALGSTRFDNKDKKNDKKNDKKDDDKDSGADMYAGTAKGTDETYIIVLSVSKPSDGKVSGVSGFVGTKSSFDPGGEWLLTIKGAYSPKSGEINARWKGNYYSDKKGDVDGEPIPGGFKVTLKSNSGGKMVFGNVTKVDDEADGGSKDDDAEAGNKPDDNSKPAGKSDKPQDKAKPAGKSDKPEEKAKPAAKPDPSKPPHTKPPTGN